MIGAAFAWLILSLVVGALSRNRGHSFIAGTLFALVLSPLIAGIIVLVRRPNTAKLEARAVKAGLSKKCPQCAEVVRAEAVKCKHCGFDFPPPEPPPVEQW